MSLSRRARKQLIAAVVLVALVVVVGVGGNALRLARKASSAAEGLRLGTEAFEKGDYERTLTQLGRYLSSNQNDADALYMHAKARLEVPQDGGGHYATALSWARRASDLDPDSIAKRLLVLEVLARSQSGSLQDYLAAIDNVLSIDPNRTDLRLLKADVLRASDRPDDALRELRSIVARDPSSIEALSNISLLLMDRTAEYNQWVTELDRRAAESPDNAALDIARITARLRLIAPNPAGTGTSAIAASRALTAYDILTQSLLPKSIEDPKAFRAALAVVDEVERAIRLTRPQSQDGAEATEGRLETINEQAASFVDRHTEDPIAHPARFLAAMEWLWTSDRTDQLRALAAEWREVAPADPESSAAIAIEAMITVTQALSPDQLVELPEPAGAPAGRLWIHLADASRALQRNELTETNRLVGLAGEAAASVESQILFSADPPADRSTETFIATIAGPTMNILRAESAARAGDTARAIGLWTDAARARRAWDHPALQLLSTFRNRGSISEADQMSDEAMLRGATLGTGLSLIEARVDQYALGGLSYDNVARFLAELRDAGFEASPVAVGQFRLALIGAIREPDRATESAAEAAAILRTWIDASADDPAAAETLVSMLGVADALGVLNRPDLLAPDLVETASEAIAGRFANLSPESKYAASLIEVARTGVYGPALARLTDEVRRFSDGAGTADALGFEHERILARFTAELARTYQALEDDAYNRVRAFSEAYPDNAAAQLLFIDSLLRAGEVPPARTGPLTEALDRLRNTLGADSYTYNLAESRRLYANTETRTPDVARQEIISRLDRFVEGQQAGSAPVEVLVLVAKWWELLPNSLERRLGYLRRAQQTSPTAWGIYPDFIRALGEAGEWDEAAAALNVWARQLTPSLGLRSDRRDLAQFVGDRFNRIAAQAADSRSAEIQALLWSIAVEDAFVIAETTGTPGDRLRVAQVLVAAPDVADARDRALAILGLDELAATRVTESRPATIGRDEAVADLTVAAAVEYADRTLRDLPGDPGLSEDTLPAIAGAAQLIAENHKLAEFTLDVASGRVTNFPATIAPEPRAEQARRALAQATRGTENDLASRAEALFYAFAYRPETWQDEADAARSAMLAASAIETLTETETQALVYPLSQLGEIETAIELQQRIADSEESGTDRIADVIAIAEILRDAGRTEDAYATLDTLSSQDRDRLTTSDIPPGPQALVALLELETGQQQTPVTSAFARRVIDQPRETRDALQLAITRANSSAPRLKLLNLISDDLAQLSESNPDGPEYRPFVAELWFSAATQAGESDPLRRELLTQTISRLNAVAQIDDDPERRVFAYQRKAYCEIELGSLDTGIRTYRQVLELEPNDPATLNNLADALKRRGQYPEALQTAERAVATSASSQLPDSVLSIFYNNLGGCHLAVGDTDSALVALRTSLDLDPSNAGARVTLAEAQLEAGLPLEQVRATIEPIGPAAEQALSSADRERLQAVRGQL